MQVFRWVLAALAGWTAIGIAGTVLAWATGDRRRALRSLAWLGGVWVIYLAVLLGVSKVQKQKTIARGQEECFDGICFSVTEVLEMGEFRGGSGKREGVEFGGRPAALPFRNDSQKGGEVGAGRLLQVGVRVRNTGGDLQAVEGLRGYLVDGAGGRWEQTRGLGGVMLTARLPGRGRTLSEPVFRVEDGTKVLGLVLTREHTGWSWLVIGDTDAMWHRRTILLLE